MVLLAERTEFMASGYHREQAVSTSILRAIMKAGTAMPTVESAKDKKSAALTGNRTQGWPMATANFTTKPLMLFA